MYIVGLFFLLQHQGAVAGTPLSCEDLKKNLNVKLSKGQIESLTPECLLEVYDVLQKQPNQALAKRLHDLLKKIGSAQQRPPGKLYILAKDLFVRKYASIRAEFVTNNREASHKAEHRRNGMVVSAIQGKQARQARSRLQGRER